METIDLFSLMPQIILATGAIVLLLSIAVRRNHLFTTVTAILFVSASFISLFFIASLSIASLASIGLYPIPTVVYIPV